MEFVSMGWANQMGNVPSGFLPSDLANLELWTRYNSGITVTGAGVSQWDDQSGNGNHLKQGTDTNRPSEEADGSILFDGTDNFLRADPFTLAQPETIYILAKQVSWAGNDRWFDGNSNSTGSLQEAVGSPQVRLLATTNTATVSATLGAYVIISSVFNGASSVLQLNNDTPITGDVGAGSMGGFVLGAQGDGASAYGNIQVKEVIVYSVAHDAATREQVISYLSGVGGL